MHIQAFVSVAHKTLIVRGRPSGDLFFDLAKDYPDLSKKPVDCPYPPYADQFTQHQHQFGPYAAMSQGKKGAE